MPYISIVKLSNDKRENTLNFAYAKLMSSILEVPMKRRQISMVSQHLESEKASLNNANKNFEDILTQPGASEAIQRIIEKNNETLDEIDKAIRVQKGLRLDLEDSIEPTQAKLEQVSLMLEAAGNPILTNSTSIGTSRYHAYNAYSKNGLFEVDRMETDITALFEKHLGGTGAKLKKTIEATGNDVEIGTYTDLFTVVYSDVHLQKVSDFFEDFKDLVIEGKKQRFFDTIMATENPKSHYMVSGYNIDHTTDEEYVAGVAKLEAEAEVAFTINGKNDTDLLSLMMEEKLTLADIQESKNSYTVYEQTKPIFDNKNEKFKKWNDNPFGGTSGISKSESGYVAAALLSMQSFMEENPELEALADKVIDKIELADLSLSTQSELSM